MTHQHGCGQVGDDLTLTAETLVGFATNPNVGAAILVSLGCVSNQPEALAEIVEASGRTVEVFRIQGCGGIAATFEAVSDAAARSQRALDRSERVRAPWSKLIVGLECVGSDAVLGETPEIIGAEHLLAERAVDTHVADALYRAVAGWERVGCINSVSCCRSFVFVDEAAEQVASSDRRGWSGGAVPSRRCLDRVGGL